MRPTSFHYVYAGLLAFLFSLTGCGYEQIRQEAPQVNIIKIHKRFTVNLPEDHRKNQFWHLKRDFDKNILRDLNPAWHGNEKGINFNFEASAVGQTTLNLALQTYGDTLTVKSFVIKIIEN